MVLGERFILNGPPFNWKQKMPLQKIQRTLAQHACSSAAGMFAACSQWSCTCPLPPRPCAWAINSPSKTRSPENDVHNNNIFVFRLIGPVKVGKPKAVDYLTCKFCCFHCKENLHWLQREALPSLMTSGSPKDKYRKGKIFKWQQTKSEWGFVWVLFCFEWEATERRKDLVFNTRVRLWPSHTMFFFPSSRYLCQDSNHSELCELQPFYYAHNWQGRR